MCTKCDVRTEYVSHEEPTALEAREARQVIQEFARYLISREGNFHFISQLLKYQLCRDESIVSNIYTLLYLLQKKKTQPDLQLGFRSQHLAQGYGLPEGSVARKKNQRCPSPLLQRLYFRNNNLSNVPCR